LSSFLFYRSAADLISVYAFPFDLQLVQLKRQLCSTLFLMQLVTLGQQLATNVSRQIASDQILILRLPVALAAGILCGEA